MCLEANNDKSSTDKATFYELVAIVLCLMLKVSRIIMSFVFWLCNLMVVEYTVCM